MEDKYCSNSVRYDDVTGQLECQQICEEEIECVGILYSYKNNYTNLCYVCWNDHLSSSRNNFGFYRRPGIVRF